jgi:hypothetical protein
MLRKLITVALAIAAFAVLSAQGEAVARRGGGARGGGFRAGGVRAGGARTGSARIGGARSGGFRGGFRSGGFRGRSGRAARGLLRHSGFYRGRGFYPWIDLDDPFYDSVSPFDTECVWIIGVRTPKGPRIRRFWVCD